jgi:hypothetical protein
MIFSSLMQTFSAFATKLDHLKVNHLFHALHTLIREQKKQDCYEWLLHSREPLH